jgi:NAD(P)-dependent dehydrogenase (short-subunit alcohol dehydrogenase family)
MAFRATRPEVVVTGASGGVGRAIAHACARWDAIAPAFAPWGAHLALLAGAEAGLTAGAARR